MKIITFCCQKSIHVYHDGCGLLPRPPFKSHASIDDAKKYMKEERGIDAKVIEFKKESIESSFTLELIPAIAEKGILTYQKS